MTQQLSNTVQQERESNKFSFINSSKTIVRTTIKRKPALIRILLSCLLPIHSLTAISLVDLILIPPHAALALPCDECSENSDGGGGDIGGGDIGISDPNPVMKSSPATRSDLPGPGDAAPAIFDGNPNYTVSTPGGSPSSAPGDQIPQREGTPRKPCAKCRAADPDNRLSLHLFRK